MAHSVDGMIQDILRREGGYVDHPADRGGATKYGVTIETYSEWLGREASKAEVKAITKVTAAAIFKERYFEGPKIDRLPADIQPFMFDAAINHGGRRAIKFLQSVCKASGWPSGPIDGIAGPVTIRAAENASESMGEWLLAALVEERRMFYRLIVDRDPYQRVFFSGWMNRVAEFDVELPEIAA